MLQSYKRNNHIKETKAQLCPSLRSGVKYKQGQEHVFEHTNLQKHQAQLSDHSILNSPPYLKDDPSNLPDSFLFWFITNQVTFLSDIQTNFSHVYLATFQLLSRYTETKQVQHSFKQSLLYQRAFTVHSLCSQLEIPDIRID